MRGLRGVRERGRGGREFGRETTDNQTKPTHTTLTTTLAYPSPMFTSPIYSTTNKQTNSLKRIKVPLPPVDEKRKVIEDVDKDRRFAIDAAIVRTMKSRKAMQHQQLVLEVVSQLSRMFKPDFKLIKKRIEDLIAREYLERDAANPQLFKYVA